MSNQIQLHERALYSYCARSWRQRTNPSRKRFSNFPRASYLDERTLTYEPIVNFSSACSSNWVGMYVWVTIDKSYWKRIELITNSASKVRMHATHSGVPEWRWNVHQNFIWNVVIQQWLSQWRLYAICCHFGSAFPFALQHGRLEKVCEKDNEPNPLSAKSVCFDFV